MKHSLVALFAVLITSAFLISDLHARGGGGGGGRGGAAPGGGRAGAGRTSTGRSGTGPGSTSAGRVGRNSNANGRSAKEWELLREQEDRKELIDQRRSALMEEDRYASQEGWLAQRRLEAADRESHTEDVR